MTVRVLQSGDPEIDRLLSARGVTRDSALRDAVARIIDDVAARGDQAVLESGQRFDSPDLKSLWVPAEEVAAARIEPDAESALSLAADRIRDYHRAQLHAIQSGWEVTPHGAAEWRTQQLHGGTIGQRMRPLQSVGVYVPGGLAQYPSSVLMNAIPADVAGVERIVLVSPARSRGDTGTGLLVAGRLAGGFPFYRAGGVAAVAALALGTEILPRVDKVVGPGNKWVNEAKRQLWGQVGLDGYAGPSEVCVVVDSGANLRFAVADLLTQIEHAEDNQGFAVLIGSDLERPFLSELDRQLGDAPRAEVMRSALLAGGAILVTDSVGEAQTWVNQIAPEHLTLAVADPERFAHEIYNAGCIMMGEWTPESGGDYVVGPSHTLPTATAARFGSPLSVADFLKVQSLSHLTADDLRPLIPAIETISLLEGLPGHGRGATIRRS